MGVLLDLVHCLSNVHTASFQFDVNDRHTIDEQHHVAAALREQRASDEHA